MNINVASVGAAIAEVVEAEMLPRYRKLDKREVKSKDGPNDLVTIVDHAVEDALRERLARVAPDAAFVGEEAAAADPSIAAQMATAAKCWIVDPLDGTRNFVNHVDEFGVIVAYVEQGVTIAGWIYAAPLRALCVGVRGRGVTWQGAPVEVRPQQDARPVGLRSIGWLTPEWRDRLAANLKAHTETRAGHCSAYAYLKLLSGEIDFKLSSRIHAWDHAAGALMVEELGGAVRWLDTLEPYRPGVSADRPLLAVAPGRDFAAIAALLRD